MPITGRPSKASSGKPEFFIQLRWMKASFETPPNQAYDLSLRVVMRPPRFRLRPCGTAHRPAAT